MFGFLGIHSNFMYICFGKILSNHVVVKTRGEFLTGAFVNSDINVVAGATQQLVTHPSTSKPQRDCWISRQGKFF